MKFRAPPTCSAVSIRGKTLMVARDGALHADKALAPCLRAHDVLPWSLRGVTIDPPRPPPLARRHGPAR